MFFGNSQSQFGQRTRRLGQFGAFLWVFVGLLGLGSGTTLAAPASGATPATPAGADLIPYEKFTLANGLTVVVHTDRKAPIVAVNVWYHVGSKNELPGKTGFAHLFEHLMFQGSEHYDDEYFKPFEQVGATSMNGTTSFDRTNYFQNVPTTALDLALWMESDRMGHLLGVVTQPRLDEQRGVVKNEKRQGENRPYGRVAETVYRASFPPGPPLPHAADRLDGRPRRRDARRRARVVPHVLRRRQRRPGAGRRHRRAHGARQGRAVLRTHRPGPRRHAARHCGSPPVPTVVARRCTTRWRSRAGSAYWNTPPDNTRDSEYLGLVGEILGGGKTSRLYERLVYRERLADSAGAGQSPLEIAGLFTLSADVKQGVAGRARRGRDAGRTAALHRARADEG